jgi:predicted RNA-binding protein with PIN domain
MAEDWENGRQCQLDLAIGNERRDMPLIIDGYNLLNATGIVGGGSGPNVLERARRALLNFLAESLSADEVARTIVVFDAADPPPGRPRAVNYRGIDVRFAARLADADTLIEQLIGEETAPRRLTVVSSDHRVQRAARRRRCRAVDSEVWFAELLHERRRAREPLPAEPGKPGGTPSAVEIEYWLRQFSDDGRDEP